ncbi:MAG TPA: hypothetical protein VKB61_01085 [Candidatus Acidoferrum sp.]|nr:hypothetical protein [Candidatus Acidoferrum sp.]
MRLQLFRFFAAKTMTATAVLGGFLLFAGAGPAKANASVDCNRRVAYTDWRYHEAVEHFGRYSSAARHWAHEHREALERCARYEREWREHRGDGDRW